MSQFKAEFTEREAVDFAKFLRANNLGELTSDQIASLRGIFSQGYVAGFEFGQDRAMDLFKDMARGTT